MTTPIICSLKANRTKLTSFTTVNFSLCNLSILLAAPTVCWKCAKRIFLNKISIDSIWTMKQTELDWRDPEACKSPGSWSSQVCLRQYVEREHQAARREKIISVTVMYADKFLAQCWAQNCYSASIYQILRESTQSQLSHSV